MARACIISLLTIVAIFSAVLLSGCSNKSSLPDNPALTPTGNTDTAKTTPGSGDAYSTYGRVYLDGNITPGALVEAVSADGTYRTSNVTDNTGVFQLLLPANITFNITAKYQGHQHKIWPVILTGNDASYNVYMTSAPRSIIAGKGTAYGGYYGYDPSKFNFSGLRIMAVPADANATISTTASGDGSYFLEVRPGVEYRLKMDTMAAVHFYYRNDVMVSNVTVGPDETALVDYDIVLP